MLFSLEQITIKTKGQLLGKNIDISKVSIDTRTLTKGDLYVAIKGEQFDGHQFISQAIDSGAVAVVVEVEQSISIPQIIVKDTRLALAQIASLWRKNSLAKVIAVTGSNGKTTVKEMLATILSVNAPILATKGNFNNEIGVPLTLLRLEKKHQYAVIEMGANHAGEIAFSCEYAQPDVSLINNVGSAHLEGFGSLEGVAKAKGEIITGLRADGVAVLNKDDVFYPLWIEMAGERRILSFALQDKTADVYATQIQTEIKNQTFQTSFILHANQQEIAVSLKLAGQHNVNNALAAVAACLAINIPLTQIKQGLESVTAVTGRLQPYCSRFGNIVIDDTYNANPSSLKVALEVLMQCNAEPWLVLGAFGELGSDSAKIHQEMGEMIKQQGIKKLLVIGEDARFCVEAFGVDGIFFKSQEEMIQFLTSHLTGNEALLIKGSRARRMENVAAALIDNFRI